MPDKGFPANSRTRFQLAVVLAAIAGIVDAIGFMEYAQLFMSFMSGNTTRFGGAASSADWVGVFRFGSVIAVFCLCLLYTSGLSSRKTKTVRHKLS